MVKKTAHKWRCPQLSKEDEAQATLLLWRINTWFGEAKTFWETMKEKYCTSCPEWNLEHPDEGPFCIDVNGCPCKLNHINEFIDLIEGYDLIEG